MLFSKHVRSETLHTLKSAAIPNRRRTSITLGTHCVRLVAGREVKFICYVYSRMTVGRKTAGSRGKTRIVNILVVDDHPLVRTKLRAVLESEADLKVLR